MLRDRCRFGLVAGCVAVALLLGRSEASLWWSLAFLVAALCVVLSPFGLMVTQDEVTALCGQLTDARSPDEGHAAAPTFAALSATLVGSVMMVQIGSSRRLIFRDELPAALWHRLASLLRFQRVTTDFGSPAKKMWKFVEFALAKRNHL